MLRQTSRDAELRPADPDKMTPTQDLVIQVLQARYRTGENIWPFDTKIRAVLAQLETGNWIFTMSGQVEGTIRAGLTDAAKHALFVDSTYVSPLEQENMTLTDRVESYREIYGGK